MYGAVRTKWPQWKTLLEKLRLKDKKKKKKPSVLIIVFEHKLNNDAVFELLRLKLVNGTQSMYALLHVRLYSFYVASCFLTVPAECIVCFGLF